MADQETTDFLSSIEDVGPVVKRDEESMRKAAEQGLSTPGFDFLIIPPEKEGELPILQAPQVQEHERGDVLRSILPGFAALVENIQAQDPKITGRFGVPVGAQVTVKEGPRGTVATAEGFEKPSVVEQAAFAGGVGLLEATGVPTRIFAATVKNINPFASAEDKGKTFGEVFSDPDSGIFKEARKIVRNSDLPRAVKFIIEMGIAIPEDPLAFIGGIINVTRGVARRATRQAAKREAAKIGEDVAKTMIPDRLPVGGQASEALEFTPAQRELLGTGTVSKKTAAAEIGARETRPDLFASIEQGRAAEIAEKMKAIEQKHGFNFDQETLSKQIAEDASKAFDRFKKETDDLYADVNLVADPQPLTAKTQQFATETFEGPRVGLTDKRIIPKPPLTQKQFNDALAEAQRNGIPVGFKDSKEGLPIPINKNTGQPLIDMNPRLVPASTASGMGITPSAFSSLKRAKRTLAAPVTTKELRNVKKALAEAERKALTSKQYNSARILRNAREDLNIAIVNQMEETLGSPELIQQWLRADKFFSQNADSMKPMISLVYKKTGKKRTPKEIFEIFDRVPATKKGIILDRAMEFFDEAGMKNLRNLYFNDLIQTASKGGFTGQKLRTIVNQQGDAVLNRVLTTEMKKDIADLMTDALADDVAKTLTQARLRKLTEKQTARLLEDLVNVKPAYRLIMATRGFTRLSLKSITPTLFIDAMRNIRAGVKRARAERFLRGQEDAGLVKLIMRSMPAGVSFAGKAGTPQAAARQIETERRGNPPIGGGEFSLDDETAQFLEGL